MSNRTISSALSLCLLCTLFSGCNQQVGNSGPGAMGSQVWEVMSLTYGVLEAEPLSVLPWNSGRCEATSQNTLAETELGYYYFCNGFLYYADKSDLNHWILLCNRPDCKHWDLGAKCDAHIVSGQFVIKDGRIFFQGSTSIFRDLFPHKGNGRFLISMAPDGTDKQLAYVIEESILPGGGNSMAALSSTQWVYLTEQLDKNGDTVYHFYCTTDAGSVEFATKSGADLGMYLERHPYGEEAYYCNVLGSAEYGCYRFAEGNMTETECSGLEMEGAYLYGNTLRVFRPNDGYYDVDLTTREEMRLASARMENSKAAVILPNCILESTLLNNSADIPAVTHKMELFDGRKWREVTLPEELMNVETGRTLIIESVNSDSIFLRSKKNDTASLYRISLANEELRLEHCSDIVTPSPQNAK